MAKTDNLHKAKEQKNDEFYTLYEDIQKELNYYETQFEGKTILCNCDDPFESNFCKFFLRNFNYLKLKRLICTSYNSSPVAGTQLSFFDLMEDTPSADKAHGYVLDVSKVPMANNRGVSDADIDKLLRSKKMVKELKGNGDFRSAECVEYLNQADIVVTNPPFSLLDAYITFLIEHNKQFLIIGNENSIKYKDIFPMFKDNKIWLGYTHPKKFKQPDASDKTFGYIGWFTNLYVKKHHENTILYKSYSPENYPIYDELPEVIMVKEFTSIPKDYDGYMAVPFMKFFEEYNPEQFEVFDMLNRYTVLDYFGVNESVRTRHSHCCNINGNSTFSRVVIKRKEQTK